MSGTKRMKIKRKREIVVERERSVTFKIKRNSGETICDRCGTSSPFIRVDEAALVAQTNSRSIFRLVETGTLHSLETREGWLLVCPTSLSAIKNQISEF